MKSSWPQGIPVLLPLSAELPSNRRALMPEPPARFLPSHYLGMPKLMQAIIDARGRVIEASGNRMLAEWREREFQERLAEVERVDQPDRAFPWASPEIRDSYLAAIMDGKILIGS